MKITFLGATRTVTGSKYLLEHGGYRFLVDCGLFQGLKELRLRNRQPFPVPASSIRCVILTHAHLDHSGYVPVLMKQGFTGPVYATPGTAALCEILLPDSGKIQEEEAGYANKKGFSKHNPALPLYTAKDAEWSLRQFQTAAWKSHFSLTPGLKFRFDPAGHILGAASVTFEFNGKSLLFSGDLGRQEDPVFHPPQGGHRPDYLVVESTYGGRLHSRENLLDQLEAVISRTIARGGVVVIPAFAVGRAQTILHCLAELRQAGRIAEVPIYLNSPMSDKATRLLLAFPGETHLSEAQRRAMASVARTVTDERDSKLLNELKMPMIILSASGMATGGRVLHHIKAFGPDPKNTILFTGFQAEGTRGALLMAGKKEVRIHGQLVDIAAEIVNINAFSAHADAAEILLWISQFERLPKKVFVTHGEPQSAEALKAQIEEKFGIPCELPAYGQEVEL